MRPCIVCLYSYSDTAARPWLDAGYPVVSVDLKHKHTWARAQDEGEHYQSNLSGDNVTGLRAHMRARGLFPALVIGFPPCTDLAVSGARHFAAKRRRNPEFHTEAMALVYACRAFGCPWIFENPVSVISSLWRKPDTIVQPWHYSGHIPETEALHPRWPEVIPPRDHYNKTTCLWYGDGARAPVRAPHPDGEPREVFPGWAKLGGKSERTKEIRSETPRGMAIGIFLANRGVVDAATVEKKTEKVLTQAVFSFTLRSLVYRIMRGIRNAFV